MSQSVVFGRYELLERIAEGGMAEVWRARARGVAGFEKTVVIKRVLPSLTSKPGFVDLLVREAKIAARLSHPSIAQIFELGEEQGSYFIVMEYVHGKDLGAAMAHRGAGHDALSLPLRAWIVAEVAKALDHAHRRKGDDGRAMQIVHRDVSPQNILLGYEGQVKIADFGIARADEAGLGRGEDPRVLRGKYAYMSPEQARGEPLDRRSDVFSLGIVLYELLTGKRLFRGRTSQETLALVRAAQAQELDPEALGIPEELTRVITRALAPVREDRYAWAGEMHTELSQFLFGRGEPVGERELAIAMERMFPPEEAATPNKLRVDVLMRAYDDATAISGAGALIAPAPAEDDAAERTAAQPIASRKLRMERRRIALLVAEERPDEDALFSQACATAGGTLFPPIDGMRLAAFGHAAGVERAAAHATRAALELRRVARLDAPARLDPVPPMAVLDGEGRVLEDVVLEPEEALLAEAQKLLEGTPPGEIRVAPGLGSELAFAFRIAPGTDRRPSVEGFRTRGERDASGLRKRAPLVGRREDLRVLSEALVRAAEGGHEVVQLVGEPGSGKSRLLAELRAVAAPQDFAFVVGRADEADAEHGYAALADVVRDLCGVESEDTPSERFAKVDRLRVLGLSPREVRLCGELVGLAYPVASVERPGRARGVELAIAVRKAITALSHDRVVVVAFEDVHWMDDATRQILPLLVRGLRRPRVLVLVTRRAGAGGPILPGRAVRVGPLSAEFSGRLFATLLGGKMAERELVAAVHEETAGNAGWIEVLAAGAREAELVRVDGGTAMGIAPLTVPIPSHVQHRISARVAQLRALDRSVLATAAAFDAPVATELLMSIEGLVGHTGAPVVRRLLARRLLVDSADGAPRDEELSELGAWGGDDPRDVPARLTVPGRLLRRAILGTLDDGELRRLHGRIVAALERSAATGDGEAMARLAYHASRSVDRRRAPEYLVKAAELASRRGERRAAAEALALAAEILREEGDDPGGERVLELGLEAVQHARAAGERELEASVLAALQQAYGARGRPMMRVAIAEARAASALRMERSREALAIMREVHDVLASVPEALQRSARHTLGTALLAAGEVDEAAETLRALADECTAGGDALGKGMALSALAVALAASDRLLEADATVEEALALAARLGHGELRYASLAAMAAVSEALDDPSATAARYREAAEVAAQVGLDDEVPAITLRAAVAALRAGEDRDAAVRVDHASIAARKRKLDAVTTLASAVHTAIAIASFPDAGSIGVIVRAVERLEGMERPVEVAIALEMMAIAHEAIGDAEAAARSYERAAATAQAAGHRALARRLRAHLAA